MKVRFIDVQMTDDGLCRPGDVADLDDRVAARFIAYGRAELVKAGRPRKEQTRSIDRTGLETR